MAKKSGGGGVGLVLLGGVVVLIAAVPKEVWIALGVIATIGAVLYFVGKSKVDKSAAPASPERWPPASTAKSPSSPRSAPRTADEPVSVCSGGSGSSGHRVPAAPAGYGNASWIPPGQAVNVAGVTIPGGMVYIGTALRNPSGRNDPCLIDPTKTVAASGDYTQRQMDYWPSYSEVTPAARRAYLDWLAGGRKDPGADVGYVFLFLYGLERRAIIDGSSEDTKIPQDELAAIAAEVRRLLGIYRKKSGSFHRYATDFLTVVELATYTDKLYEKPLPQFSSSGELPLYLRLALGQCASANVPVPPHLALAWVRLDPNIYLRTPATRCADEFAKLFERKYVEAFGDGLVLPKNKTRLKFVYRPASAGLHEYGEIKLTFGDTPDVAVLTGPVKKLQDVAEAVTVDLEGYSRYLGRTPSGAGSLEGLLLLPPTLWPDSAQKRMSALAARMERGMAAMPLKELISALGNLEPLDRNTVSGVARALEAMNIAMEPDVLGGAKTPKADDTLVLFTVQPSEVVNRTSPAYQAAALTLQLATAVAMADGEMAAEEMRQLRNQIEGWNHLTPGHHQRLRAHMRLLIAAPPSLTVLKKKLDPLEAAAKEAIAKFMAVVAQADGKVTPAEIKMLEKVYKALGVDPQKVFGDVHAVAAAAPAGAPVAAPTTVLKKPAAGFQLDAARIAALQQDTDKVSALLANIFTDETLEATPATKVEPEVESEEAPHGLMGLDDAHTSFVRQLMSRPEWTREELLDLASDLDLMLDGALERINEASFDAHDMALTEGEDPITVNRDVLEKAEA